MKITNVGGATAILEHKGKRILFDPWLNEGIFHGAWYHFPPLRMGNEDLGRFDYVYISHIHEDHCAAGTIEYLNRDAEILLMDRRPNFVAKFLDTHGFEFKKVHHIAPFTPTELEDGLVVDMLTADPKHELAFRIDSALILNWDGFVVYNANDCHPYEEGIQYIIDTHPAIDLALLPYCGGSGYPACYTNLSHEEKVREQRRIRAEGLKSFSSTVSKLDPKYALPFADQYVIAGSRSPLNQYMAHPPCPGEVEGTHKDTDTSSELLLLNSAQTFDFDSRKKSPDEPYEHFTEAERQEYIDETLAKKTYDYDAFPLNPAVPLDRLIQHARDKMLESQRRENYFPDFSYYLDVPDREQRFRIDFREESAQAVSWQSPLTEPYLRLSAPSTLMALLLIGHISWNIADAALFLDYERVPNDYDPKIHTYINFLKI